jgi:hypothetical protein
MRRWQELEASLSLAYIGKPFDLGGSNSRPRREAECAKPFEWPMIAVGMRHGDTLAPLWAVIGQRESGNEPALLAAETTGIICSIGWQMGTSHAAVLRLACARHRVGKGLAKDHSPLVGR